MIWNMCDLRGGLLMWLPCLALVACGGERSASPPVGSVAPGVEQRAVGSIVDAPDGTVVFLAAPAQGSDLLAQAEALVGTVEVDAAGRFALPPSESARELVVSAPGRALLRVPIEVATRPLVLEPEAVVECRVLDPEGDPEPLALALVLADGVPLPLPPLELVSRGDGVLRATRLPAGRYELLLASADGARHARLDVEVGRGQRLTREVRLEEDGAAARRFFQAAGAKLLPGASR